MVILYLILGIAIGFALCWFYLKSKPVATDGSAELQTQIAVQAERVQALERDKAELSAKLQTAALQAQTLTADLARTQTMLRSEEESYEKLQRDSDEMREQLRREFENLANRILEEKTDKFTKLNQSNLTDILNPLQIKLREFEQKVDQVYRTEAAERNSLRGEIKNLVDLNQQISKEASNLARALKGDTKKQGNWGELILEKVLEFSGLRKDIEYKMQVSISDADGRRLQPDAIVYLPDSKHIVVDAKVSLVAYERYIASVTDEERDICLADHISSVKSHIKNLSDKNYSSLSDLDAPDFTLLFMPIESSFGLAIQADNELFNYAWERKIVIVSPSTLLATLRTIASIWKQERQTKNAIEIADRAGKMYDKFVGFMEDLVAVGKKMDEAKKGYEGAMNKLTSGTGNLVRQSEQLKELGAKATKQIQPSLLDRSE
jgi:DNA recombination protein RmuC